MYGTQNSEHRLYGTKNSDLCGSNAADVLCGSKAAKVFCGDVADVCGQCLWPKIAANVCGR